MKILKRTVMCLLTLSLMAACGKDDVPEPETPGMEDTDDEGGTDDSKDEPVIETFTVKGVTFNMVFVEGGTFQMGATPEMDDLFDDEFPVHQVTLSDYYIGQTEVTQALWEAVMGYNPCSIEGDNLPVEMISWEDCQQFILKLRELTGIKFRRPTEAEWEFAARGGRKSKANQFSGSDDPDKVAWYWKTSGDNYIDLDDDEWSQSLIENNNCRTHEVASLKPNELGIYDMAGNVSEWCQDWYEEYSDANQTNPSGPTYGSKRVVRGGGWNAESWACRTSFRGSAEPEEIMNDTGLRLALTK